MRGESVVCCRRGGDGGRGELQRGTAAALLSGARLPAGLTRPRHGRGDGVHRHGDRPRDTERHPISLQRQDRHHHCGESFRWFCTEVPTH